MPGSAEEAIRHWDETWRVNPDQDSPTLRERILVAEDLEKRGRHYTFAIKDGDKPVAGETLIVIGQDLVSHTCWRDRAYDRHGVGTRLSSEIFYWAAQNGFKNLNWGGWYDYKKRWAPATGSYTSFDVAPPTAYYYRKVERTGKYLRSKTCGAIRKATRLFAQAKPKS